MRDINKYSDNYLVQDFEIYQVEYRRKKIIEQIAKYHPQRILEIGCGSEPLFQYVEGKEWVIVEPSKAFCKIAESKKGESDHVNIIQGFLEERISELEQESFDMIICSSLLHEVEEPERMIKDIFKLCGDKTIVHINVPNAKSFHRILARNMGIVNEYEKSERNVLLQQNIVFDMDKLINMVTGHNFEVLDRGSYFIKPFTHKQMYDLIEKEIIDKKVLDGLYNMANEMPMLGSEIFVNCRKTDNKKEKTL